MQIISFGERRVIIAAPFDLSAIRIESRFVVLLPALSFEERDLMLNTANKLLELGCSEFCCVGVEAELLHDQLDELIEDLGRIQIATTSDVDAIDACEYFLFGAGGQEVPLLALIHQHPELIKTLISTLERDD